MPNYDPIEQEIIDALNVFGHFAQRRNYSTGDWTKGVFAIFGAIGYQKGYQTYFSNRPNFDQVKQDIERLIELHVPDPLSEWLYDILWWHQNDQGYATDIPLVAESEWGGNFSALQDDFPKLLLARSKYKFMIFEGRPNDISQQIDWCKRQIKTFAHTQSGDRYFFCAWPWSQNPTFHFELYVVP